MDPVVNPALLFRMPEELSKSPAPYLSKLLTKAKASPVYRSITSFINPRRHSVSTRAQSIVAPISKTEAESFIDPVKTLATPRSSDIDPIKALEVELLNLIRDHRVYRSKDLQKIFDEVREANMGLSGEEVETALRRVIKTLDS